MKPSKLTFTYY